MMIGNYVMGIASILFCLEAKLGRITLAMCAVAPVVFVVSALYFTDPDILSTLGYFLIVYCALVLLGIANYRQLYFEQQWSDHVDNMSEEEMRSLDLLSEHPELSTDKTTSLLDRLDDKRRSHIINNVSQYVRDEYAGREAIASLSPELTESEIQICQLIMQGNSLKEICDIMKKGESNISSQRSHIRKKLGMQHDDNMRMFLEQRLYSNSAFRGGLLYVATTLQSIFRVAKLIFHVAKDRLHACKTKTPLAFLCQGSRQYFYSFPISQSGA